MPVHKLFCLEILIVKVVVNTGVWQLLYITWAARVHNEIFGAKQISSARWCSLIQVRLQILNYLTCFNKFVGTQTNGIMYSISGNKFNFVTHSDEALLLNLSHRFTVISGDSQLDISIITALINIKSTVSYMVSFIYNIFHYPYIN